MNLKEKLTRTRLTMPIMDKLVCRTYDSEKELRLTGYFARFDDVYSILEWDYSETIDRNAFNRALKEKQDVRALIDHNTNLVLGRTKSGTLNLKTDDKGLYGEIIINPKDTDALNIYERVKRGDVSGCSFGFTIKSYEETKRDDGKEHINITDLDLYEVSICTFPAYEQTDINARHNLLFEEVRKSNFEAKRQELLKKLRR